MERIKISNGLVEAQFKAKGAELCSFKFVDDPVEYIWYGKPELWGRQAPILFPIVGRLLGNKCQIAGEEYHMGQHGFARDQVFEVIMRNEDQVAFSLRSNEETRKMYPFDFELVLSYKLVDDTLVLGYEVKNLDNDEMYFSIGAHPGFNCPLVEGEAMEDYVLDFYETQKLESLSITAQGISKEKYLVAEEARTIGLSNKLFDRDALVLDNLKVDKVGIRSGKHNRGVSVEFDGFPYVGIWSLAEPAPFVCIEPWYGIADFVGSNGVYEEKIGVNKLKGKGIFKTEYSIKIYK